MAGTEQQIADEQRTRIIPLAYEVHVGWGKERRVLRTMSEGRADKVYRRLSADGNPVEIWLGRLRLK
jgi:hypothetical protein